MSVPHSSIETIACPCCAGPVRDSTSRRVECRYCGAELYVERNGMLALFDDRYVIPRSVILGGGSAYVGMYGWKNDQKSSR